MCVNSLSAFSPRESSKSVADGHPKGHRGCGLGAPSRVRTLRELSSARQLRGIQRGRGEPRRPRCVKREPDLFDLAEGLAPHWTRISNAVLSVVRESSTWQFVRTGSIGAQARSRTDSVRRTAGRAANQNRKPRATDSRHCEIRAISSSISTGLTAWASKPAWRVRSRSWSCP